MPLDRFDIPMTRMLKTCTFCGERKPTRSGFRWMPSREAFHPWCRECERIAYRKDGQK